MHSRGLALMVAGVVLSALVDAQAVVVCQKKKKVTLRADTCRKGETAVALGPSSVPALVAPPTCGAGQVLSWNGAAFACVADATGVPTPPSCAANERLQWNGSAFQCVPGLACTTVQVAENVPNTGVLRTVFANCPAGTVVTGGGCVSCDAVAGVCTPESDVKRSTPNDPTNGWVCQAFHTDVVSHNLTAYARCCSLP